MNIHKLLIFLFSISFVFPAFSQRWEDIKGSPDYLWGEGWGTTVAAADQQALKDLIEKISVQVSGNTTHHESETASSAGIESVSNFSSMVSTYSNATLTNTEKEILENEPDAHVGRWIKKSEVARIFENRKNKITDYIESALNAERHGKVDVALKDFYWALALTQTLQDPNGFSFKDENGKTVMPVNWIPRKINDILDNINIVVGKRTGDDVELSIFYKNIPVNTLDYTFFDGRDWSNIYSAKDGIGVLELAPGNRSSTYQIKVEYEFKPESHIDKEIENVLNVIGTIPIRNAYKSVKAEAPTNQTASSQTSYPSSSSESTDHLKVSGKPLSEEINETGSSTVAPSTVETPRPTAASFSTVAPDIYSKPKGVADIEEYQKRMEMIAASIVKKRYDDVSDFFTPDAKEIYEDLIKYGQAKIVGDRNYEFFPNGDKIVARGLKMAFSFKTGLRKSFVEEVIFTFDKDGKIDNINFGLGKTAEDDILGKGVWSENARMAIMNFLENYQTAYALKRLDYISSIFDDDAVIITGSVSKVPGKLVSKGDYKGIQFGHDIIKYNRHTKDSYLAYLKKSFASKEFINLRFADNDVRKLGKGGELYAIQISQEYYSSNYGDKGYLFLMVDINDPENPIIKVRTWQPDKDPNFGLYGPEHFK